MPENDHERLSESNAKLKEMLLRRMPGPGDFQTAVEGLVLLRREEAGISEKTFEKPLAAFIIQGSKQSFFGGRDYFYRENQYLVAGLDMPASFRAMPATSEEPFLSAFFYLDRQLIADLSLEMARETAPVNTVCPGVNVADTDPELLDGVARLIGLLDRPEQIPVRAPMLMRELHYLLLLGPYGASLRQLNTLGTQSNQVVQAIDWLRKNVTQPVRVESLARQANMPTSTLHRHFKSLTGLSPLQYITQLRLYEAQRLMLMENERAASAALAVGYESVTQFNREYKRMFGEPPHRDIARRKGLLQRGEASGTGAE